MQEETDQKSKIKKKTSHRTINILFKLQKVKDKNPYGNTHRCKNLTEEKKKMTGDLSENHRSKREWSQNLALRKKD